MRKIVKQRLWTQVIAIVLAMALNLGVLDGIINGLLRELHKGGLISSRVQLNSIAPAYADPGEGSFTPGIFDPNHNETSTLKFKFDYDHDTEIELFKGGNKIKTLEESIFFEGRYDDEEDETPENITNQYTWNVKMGPNQWTTATIQLS